MIFCKISHHLTIVQSDSFYYLAFKFTIDALKLLSVTNEGGDVIFCWSESDQGLLLSAYFYGYIVFQVFGGSLAEKAGTKIVLGGTTLFCALLTLLLPIASKQSIWIVFILRIFQGLAAGVTYPCLPPMIMR